MFNNKILIYLIAIFIPFVGAYVPTVLGSVYQLQLFDIARFFLTILFLFYFPIYVRRILNFKFIIKIILILTLANVIAMLMGIIDGSNSKSNSIDILNLPLSLFYYILIPVFSLHIIFSKYKDQDKLRLGLRMVNISNIIVIIVCFFQINSLFNIIEPISYLYNNYLFYFLEGRWMGWENFQTVNSLSPITYLVNISTSPIVTNIKRLSGTFQEPASLAIYCSIMMLPFFFTYLEQGCKKYCSMLTIVASPFVIFFTASSTGYLVFFINLIILLVAIFSKRQGKIKSIILLSLSFILLIVLFPFVYEKIYVLEKLYSITDDSSSTRFGSILAALYLFINHPLGVSYGMHQYLLSEYIPAWSNTIENTRSIIALHSFLMRIIVDFGVMGIVSIFMIFNSLLYTLKIIRDTYLHSLSKYIILNLFILSLTDIPFNEVWLIFIIYLLVFIFPIANKISSNTGSTS